MIDLNKVAVVTFIDFSEYDPEKCYNGGCYGFWTNYVHLENGLFEIRHRTTSDFSYCPVCGSFENHFEPENLQYKSGYSCGEFETITKDELLNRINSFQESDGCFIEIF